MFVCPIKLSSVTIQTVKCIPLDKMVKPLGLEASFFGSNKVVV